MSKLFPNATIRTSAPYRFDIVGSFLRPEALKQARSQCSCGDISCADLSQVEDTEIAKLVEHQKNVGLHAVTDGEFRRTFWHLDFLAALDGVQEIDVDKFSVQFKHHSVRPKTLKIVDKIGFPANHPFIEHYRSLQRIAGTTEVKLTIPSPSMLHLICTVRTTDYQPIIRYQNNNQQLLDDIADAYIVAMQTFYQLGCRNLQLDDTSWGEFCAEDKRKSYSERGLDLAQIAKDYVYMLNKIVAAKPADLAITMHICRGNFRSTWFSAGGYEPIAETLFGHCNVDGFSWNTTAIVPVISNHYALLKINKWCLAWLPRNRGNWKIVMKSSLASKKRRNTWISTNFVSVRNVVLLQPKKAIF